MVCSGAQGTHESIDRINLMDIIDTLIKEHPELFIKPDPELMALVDDLVKDVVLDDFDSLDIVRI